MPGYRHNRMEGDILREMTALLRELKDPRIDPLLSVVHVDLSADMSQCKIYVSSLSGKETAKQSCMGLDNAKHWIRQELFRRLGMRKSPALLFIADDSIAHGVEIDRMIDSVKTSENSENGGRDHV